MTQIEKEAFFALYWGQEVMIFEDEHQTFKVIVQATSINNRQINKQYLQLKSIESITDEDLQMCHYILFCENKKEISFKEDGFFSYWTCNDSYVLNEIIRALGGGQSDVTELNYDFYTILELFDFLRSKGYLLPFRQYSVEQLIESGIVKI